MKPAKVFGKFLNSALRFNQLKKDFDYSINFDNFCRYHRKVLRVYRVNYWISSPVFGLGVTAFYSNFFSLIWVSNLDF